MCTSQKRLIKNINRICNSPDEYGASKEEKIANLLIDNDEMNTVEFLTKHIHPNTLDKINIELVKGYVSLSVEFTV